MEKHQALIELFKKKDTEGTGEVGDDDVFSILIELGIDYLYQGSVTKAVRNLNYQNPEKKTLNLNQLKEYYDSFASESKQKLWKAKYSAYSFIKQKRQLFNEGENTASAAPGGSQIKQETEEKPDVVDVTVAIGPKQLNAYTSSINFKIQKASSGQSGKPFVKLTLEGTDNESTKNLQTLLKHNFAEFIKLLGEEQPTFKDQLEKIHLSTLVKDTILTVFLTTSSEDMIELITIYAQVYDKLFNLTVKGGAEIDFRFNYDFQTFVKDGNSNFYDMLTKNCKLRIQGSALNVLKSLRSSALKEKALPDSSDYIPLQFITSLLHLQNVSGLFEFDNAEYQYSEKESKSDIISGLGELKQFLHQLDSSGLKIFELIGAINNSITIQAVAGDWKSKIAIKIKNLNKLFLEEFAIVEQQPDYYD